MLPNMIDGKFAKSLASAQVLKGVVLLGQPGGFAVLVQYGTTESVIVAQRSQCMRVWRDLSTAANYVREELGLERFEIDMTEYDPTAVLRARPDAAERQRQLHRAGEHDAWFRSEVQKALDGAEDGSNPIISEGEWSTRVGSKRADLKRLAGL